MTPEERALNKLDQLLDKESTQWTKSNWTLIVSEWNLADFPRALERKVRSYFKSAPALKSWMRPIQAQYAKLDEKSAQYLVDPCIEAQDALIRLNDEDDMDLLVRRARNFSEISDKLWRVLLTYTLTRAQAKALYSIAIETNKQVIR
jgi:hypothetical protein